MADYAKLVDYAAKDALLTGNPSKLVKGTEIGADFDAVAVAIATKYDSTDLGVTLQAYDAQLADVAGLTPTDNGVIIGNGSNFVVESGATLKTSLGLTIGTDVQAYDADLTTWAGVTPGTGVATALAVNIGSAGAAVLNGGVLGTPSSGTLTNCTGLPAAGVTGTASTLTGTETLTNKRVTARVGSTASSATPTINTDNYDVYKITALTVDITSMTTNLSGTPQDGDVLIIEITGTAARAITWGASFEASTVALPTTTVTTAMLAVAFLWNTATSKWRCVGAA